MAYETGTAANRRDALQKIRTFLTSHADLVAAGQQWQELRWLPDNIESVDTNMSFAFGSQLHLLFRPDHRTQNYTGDQDGGLQLTATFRSGQYVRWKLCTARAVTTLRLKAPPRYPQYFTPRDFSLQYSDDGDNWTTAVTVAGQTGEMAVNEERSFPIPSPTGTHLWWRLVTTSTNGGSGWSLRSLWCYDGDELVNSSEGNLVLKGTGLAGADEIFLFLRTYYHTGVGSHAIMMNAGTGYLPSEQSLLKQPGLHPWGFHVIPLWDVAMPYWIVGSGRRVIFVFKVSTVYEAGYGGLFLPYATPAQYALPLAVGGSMSPSSTPYRYDSVTASHSVFCMPGGPDDVRSAYTQMYYTTLAVMLPDGSWFDLQNRGGASESYAHYGQSPASVLPHSSFGWGFREDVGGGYSPVKCSLFQRQPSGRWLGELDGVVQISGFSNGSENTGTLAGNDYVVFQNTYRNDIREFWAIKAE